MYTFFSVGSFNNIIFSPGVDNEACGYRQEGRAGRAGGQADSWLVELDFFIHTPGIRKRASSLLVTWLKWMRRVTEIHGIFFPRFFATRWKLHKCQSRAGPLSFYSHENVISLMWTVLLSSCLVSSWCIQTPAETWSTLREHTSFHYFSAKKIASTWTSIMT